MDLKWEECIRVFILSWNKQKTRKEFIVDFFFSSTNLSFYRGKPVFSYNSMRIHLSLTSSFSIVFREEKEQQKFDELSLQHQTVTYCMRLDCYGLGDNKKV